MSSVARPGPIASSVVWGDNKIMRSEGFLKVLSHIRNGELHLVTPDGVTHRFQGDLPGEKARIVLKDWSVIRAVLAGGDIGLGETYMDELWETDDLPALLTFCQRNRPVLLQIRGLRLLNGISSWIAYYKAAGTPSSAASRNMAATYDYPPALFQTFTDRMMTAYSSGWWGGEDMSLDDAQVNKYNRITQAHRPGTTAYPGNGLWSGLFPATCRGPRLSSDRICMVSRQQYRIRSAD